MDWKARAWHMERALEKGKDFLIYRCRNCGIDVHVDIDHELPDPWEKETQCIKCYYEDTH